MAGAGFGKKYEGCGCGETRIEFISPACYDYLHTSGGYVLAITVEVCCGCGRYGRLVISETVDSMDSEIYWLKTSRFDDNSAKVIDLKDWPREIERIAVEWALELEGKE